jgi:pimeloyl-ACP methyl ester carboxylesterase
MTDRDTATGRDGTTIAYDVVGDGPGIVLVPGALHSGHHYAALARCLADAFTVYCVDRRGRPGSGPQRPDHGIDAECADLIAVLEKTGAKLAFGHSSGGVVALQTALRRPLAKLAVYEPPVSLNGSVPSGFMPAFERALARGRKPDALAILGKGLDADRKVDKLPTSVLKLLMRLASRGADPKFRELIEATATFPAEHRMIAGLDPTAYERLEPETLVLLGDRSPGYLARAATFLADTAPGAQLLVLAGLDHSGPEQQAPDRLAGELRAFFASAEQPAGT